MLLASENNSVVSDSVLLDVELPRDMAQFDSLCASWKASNVGVVLQLSPVDIDSLARLQAAIESCARHEIAVWLRIEYSKTSGYSKTSENVASYIAFQTFDLARGALALFENVNEVVSAVAVPRVENDSLQLAPRLLWKKARNIADDFAIHVQNQFRDLTDDWGQARVFLWSRHRDHSRFDALDADATQRAISSTRTALQTVLSSSQARLAVRGIVLDAPRLWSENAPDALRRFPWHDALPPLFKARHNADLADVLPSLIADTGSDAVRVRLDFWACVTQLVCENFGQSWRAFADENNYQLRFDWTDDNLNHLVANGADMVELARFADSCGLQIEEISTSSTRATLRLLSSLTELRDDNATAKRVLVRQNDVSLSQKNALWFAGANAFETRCNADFDAQNETAIAAYTARISDVLGCGKSAARVGVLWPGRSLHAHHHPKAHRFVRWIEEDIAATMQMLDSLHLDFLFVPEDEIEAADVRHRVLDVAAAPSAITPSAITPSAKGFSHHETEINGTKSQRVISSEIEKSYDAQERQDSSAALGMTQNLSDVTNANSQNAALICGASRLGFECVVLPSVTCLSRAAWRKLSEFVDAGGKIVCLGLLPRWSEIGRDEELEAQVERATRTNIEDVYDSYRLEERGTLDALHQSDPSSVGYPVVRQTLNGGRFSTYQPRLNVDRDDARLRVRGLLVESVTPEVETQSTSIKHRARVQGNRTTFWTWNDNERSHRANLLLRPLKNLSSMDDENAWDNSSTRCAVWMSMPQAEGGGAAFSAEYAPDETRIFAFNDGDFSDSNPMSPHLESATFKVETFDGEIARGLAMQSGTPSISLRQGGKSRQFFGANCVVPSPLSLDEWTVAPTTTHIEYSMSCVLLAQWRHDLRENSARLWLQIVPPSHTIAAEAVFDNGESKRVFTSPWTFELPRKTAENESLFIKLRVWPANAENQDFAARIVLYPRVEIAAM